MEGDRRGLRKGAGHYKAVLTLETVVYIKKNRDKGPWALSKELGVNYSTVHSIIAGNSWKHVIV